MSLIPCYIKSCPELLKIPSVWVLFLHLGKHLAGMIAEEVLGKGLRALNRVIDMGILIFSLSMFLVPTT